jgi:hypothetical protein
MGFRSINGLPQKVVAVVVVFFSVFFFFGITRNEKSWLCSLQILDLSRKGQMAKRLVNGTVAGKVVDL